MKIKFWGTRGSIPVPGQDTIKYGGNTSCIQISNENDFIVIDAGTGIRELGKKIIENEKLKEIKIFISHTHWDHIQGLPFFAPLYEKDYKIKIFTNRTKDDNNNKILDYQLNPDFFPVIRKDLKAEIEFIHIDEKNPVETGNFLVSAEKVHHLNDALAFKIEAGEKSIVYMPDNEIYSKKESNKIKLNDIKLNNFELIKFCKNVDCLVHDCMYSFKDSMNKRGWGHSDNISLAYFSILTEIKNLILFHYEPDYSDSDIDKMVAETESIIKEQKSDLKVIPSKELLEISI